MNLFNDNNKTTSSKGRSFAGDFEDMIKARKENVETFEKHIAEHFKNYSGEMTAVITIEEDENGKPKRSNMFIGGVASAEAGFRMLQALDEAKEAIIQQIAEGIGNNPEALGAFMGDMLKDILKKHKD